MKTFLHGLCTYLTFAALYSYCNAGLLDILLGRNMTPSQQIFNVSNNPSRNPEIRSPKYSPSNLAIRDKYNVRNNSWRTQSAFPTNTIHTSGLINERDSENSDSSDDDNRIQRNTNHIARNTNEPSASNQISGLPFVNDNSGLYHPYVHQFPGNEAPTNPRFNSLNPLINRPITNTGNAGNIHKIIQDINKINNIMDQIKQENAKNQGNLDPNIKINNGNSNFYNQPTGPINYPIVHVNNGLQGVHTNLHNNNGYQGTGNIVNDVQPPRNQETNLNTAVTNANIVTPPPGILMTNLPKESLGNNNKPSASIPDVSKIDDKYVLKPIRKRKFFSQVRPVVPDYLTPQSNETLYYID